MAVATVNSDGSLNTEATSIYHSTTDKSYDNGLDKDYVMKALSLRYDFMANRLLAASRRFSTAQIIRAVELCAETDYAMKSSRTEPTELLKECVMRIAAGEEHA